MLALWAGAAAGQALPVVQVQADASAETEGRADYISPAASATATGLALTPLQTPQPVQVLTRSLLDDQDAQTVQDLAALSPGLTVSRSQLYARGFALNQWMLDGVSISFDKSFDLIQNLALYDRVEVVQGATGLMSGMGNPSAAINLVRKLPTAQPRLSMQLRTGQWGLNGAMVDAAGPLNAARTLRARLVADAQNQHSFQDGVAHRQRSYYGVVEADLAAQTTLRLGVSQQHNQRRDSFSAIPTAADGDDLGLPRSTWLGYDWEYWRQRTTMAFAQLEQGWGNGWQLRADLLRLRSELDYLGTYLNGGTPEAMQQSLGQHAATQQQSSYALSLRGPWRLAGRTHQLALGLSHRTGDAAEQGWTVPNWIGDLNVHAPQTQALPPLALLKPYAYQYRQQLSPTQTGVWLAAQLQVARSLQLILGGRWDSYRHHALAGDNYLAPLHSADRPRQQHVSRYAGLVWALDAQHSAYLQTGDIFLPGNERDTAGRLLPAAEGRTLGAGLQGQYLDQRLRAGLHLYQVTQRNAPQQEYDQSACPSFPGVACWHASGQVRSRGLLLQLQGQPAAGWDISANYTLAQNRYIDDAQTPGQRFEPQLPRQQWQLAAIYRLPHSAWRIGGSLYRQSAIYTEGLDGLSGWRYRIRQGAYTLAGLMAARQITPQWQLQVNVRNVFDKRYYQSIAAPMFTSYGAPRSVQATLRYQY